MGHKVHPIGLRLGIHRKWKSNWHFDSKNYTKFLHLNFDIEKYFKGYLYYYPNKTILVNCQIIKLPSNQIFIFVFFYRLRKKFKKIKNNAWKSKRWKKNLKNILINKYKENISLNVSNKELNIKNLNYLLKTIYNNNINNILINNLKYYKPLELNNHLIRNIKSVIILKKLSKVNNKKKKK